MFKDSKKHYGFWLRPHVTFLNNLNPIHSRKTWEHCSLEQLSISEHTMLYLDTMEKVTFAKMQIFNIDVWDENWNFI